MSRFAVLAFAAVAAVPLVVAGPAAASLIVIPNASFEDPNVADDTFTDTETDINAVPNWLFFPSFSGTTTAGVWDPNNADYSNTTGDNAALPGSAHGGQAAYIFVEQNPESPDFLIGEMASASSVATVESNTIYTLTVALGNAKTFDPGNVSLRLSADQKPVATLDVPGTLIPNDTFTDFSVQYVTLPSDPRAGAELTIHVIHTLSDTGFRSVEVDNVRLDITLIPEPTGATMLALTGLGAFAIRRPRR